MQYYNFQKFFSKREIFKIFLKVVKPNAVIAIGWDEEVLQILKQKKILSIEPVHGFGLSCFDYKSWIEPKLKNNSCPDCFLCFDNQTYKTFQSKLPKNHNVFRARYQGDRRSRLLKPFNEYQKLKLRKIRKKYKKIVLYTLQHGYDGSRESLKNILENGVIHCEVIETIKKNPRIFFLIKGHPVQLQSQKWESIQVLLQENLKNLQNSDSVNFHYCDVYSLLKASDLHVTMMSGVIVEAAKLGLVSIGLCPSLKKSGLLKNSFRDAKNKKLLKIIDLKEQKISSTLRQLLKRKRKKLSNEHKLIRKESNIQLACDIINNLLKINS